MRHGLPRHTPNQWNQAGDFVGGGHFVMNPGCDRGEPAQILKRNVVLSGHGRCADQDINADRYEIGARAKRCLHVHSGSGQAYFLKNTMKLRPHFWIHTRVEERLVNRVQ